MPVPQQFSRVLALDKSWRPTYVCSWQVAFSLIAKGKAKEEHVYDATVRTGSSELYIPAVIVLNKDVKWRRNKKRFSAHAVYERDGNTCQYCGQVFPESKLTQDHVIPACRGGKRTWDNIVAACLKCNQRKGPRTPAEAGMTVLNWPCPPKMGSFAIAHSIGNPPAEWLPYLPASEVNSDATSNMIDFGADAPDMD